MNKFVPYILVLVAGILFGLSYNNYHQVESQNKVVSQLPNAKTKIDTNSILQLNRLEASTIDLFESSVESVAFITTSKVNHNQWYRNQETVQRGSGSGFIWDDKGHIVTNYHVIHGADKAIVTLYNRKSYEAILVGVEPNKDIAVLKIDAPASELPAIPKGSSEKLKVGQSVFAIGNPFGLDYTLTTGIISALGREIESTSKIKIRDVIQTDAAINPGNSGGPLLDSHGRIIGVNTAIFSPSGASAGIGFSIPVDVVSWVVPDIIEYGYVKRPVLGIELMPYQQQYIVDGAMIRQVIPGKGADKAGLQGVKVDSYGRILVGDIITGIDEIPVKSNSDLVLALENYDVGDQITIHYIRDKREMNSQLILSEN